MQISAIEVARLLAAREIGVTKTEGVSVDFIRITPDSLPQTVAKDADEIARLTAVVKELPDERDEIVMRLKERIERGEYEINGEEIADMMIRRMKADRLR
jgi:anti-sigma28 factor (negative regulator of flagellin synthesis)